jgi:TonB-dependent SusC/RagA subfamily outer membrane receptor
MQVRKHIRIISGLFVLLCFVSFMQEDSTSRNIQKIKEALEKHMQHIAPQKVYLQTDKGRYFAGERIWFKAYLVDGITHRLGEMNDPVYVELVNPYQKSSEMIRLRITKGLGQGSFLLRDSVPEGLYQIRAFTNWMKNAGTAYYFTLNLEVRNPKQEYDITEKEARSNQKTVHKMGNAAEGFRAGFFPEGGDLLAGYQCKIAFKVTDGFGRGVFVEGLVQDDRRREKATFRSEYDGMGYFYLIPDKAEKYTVSLKFPDGSRRQYVLPEAMENTVNIALKESAKQLNFIIRSNKPPSDDRPANEFILIGQCRGKIYSAASMNILDTDSVISIDKNLFPTGIAQFTLFNNRLEPVAERIYFINHNTFIDFRIEGRRQPDSIQILITPLLPFPIPNPISGSISVLLSDSVNAMAEQQNLLTELFLGSDLPGVIQNPAHYLQTDEQSRKHADLLMLTHGWKRFEWTDVMNQIYTQPVFEHEQGITIHGLITRDILEFPIKDALVNLYILSHYNDEYRTVTGSDGRFAFSRLDYEDTISVKIVARKAGGGKSVLIHLLQDSYNPLEEYTGDFFLTTTSKIDKKAYRRTQADLAREAMNRREAELDSIYSQSIYGTPDYVLWGYEIPPGTNTVLDAIKGRIPGVNVTDNSVTIRGVNTILGNSDPLLLIDGVPTSFSAINTIPVTDIDRIEVLKGPSTAMFGSRGANGVISIYTKRGTFMKRGEISFSMLGYHVVERFYLPPAYEIESRVKYGKLPLTLYWNPEITLSLNDVITFSIPVKTVADSKVHVIFEGMTGNGEAGYSYKIMD